MQKGTFTVGASLDDISKFNYFFWVNNKLVDVVYNEVDDFRKNILLYKKFPKFYFVYET